MKKILLELPQDRVPAEVRQEIEALAPHHELLITRDDDEIRHVLADIEIAAVTRSRGPLLEAPNARWFQLWSAGADWFVKTRPEDDEAIVTNTSGIHALNIGEHVFAMLLAFARNLPQAFRSQEAGQWQRVGSEHLFELTGKTMLILGLGAIGRQCAHLAKAFGMQVIGLRRNPDKGHEGVDEMVGVGDLLSVLPKADVVVSTLPGGPHTKYLMDARAFDAMQNGAYFINIGRGETVDEKALVDALSQGSIAGAGLDVFEEEPLPESSPLWGLENVIITAHYAGETPYYTERALGVFTDNLRRFVAGEPLRNVVDKALGY